MNEEDSVPYERGNALKDVLIEVRVARILGYDTKNSDKPVQNLVESLGK